MRYEIITIENWSEEKISKQFGKYPPDEYEPFLIDTETDEVIFTQPEPEDATLYRDLYFFVQLLNEKEEEIKKLITKMVK